MVFGEGDRTVRLRNHRAQNVGVERLRQLAQLIAGASCLLDISHREHDLEMRRQEPGASQRIAGRVRQPADRRTRGVGASLRQPQECESWLWLASQFARGAICVLSLLKLAAQSMDLSLLIERGSGRSAIGALGPLTSAASFGQASGQAPCSCMISARCTRHIPVNATISGCCLPTLENAAVHSRARSSA